MTKKRIAILILVFVNAFCMAFSYYILKVTDENHGVYAGSSYYLEVSFDARIISENLYGKLKNSDGTWGKEVKIPVKAEVHVIAAYGVHGATGEIEYVLAVSPTRIDIEGESKEVSLGHISMDDIDRSAYAKDLIQTKIQERPQMLAAKIRNHLIISIIAGVILFSVFSCVFLFIEKKCTTGRRYKILFCYLIITTILSLLFTSVFYDYMGHCK